MTQKQERKYALLTILLCVVFVVVLFGKVEFHNELERVTYKNTYLGVIDEKRYSGNTFFEEEDFPVWIRELYPVEAQAVQLEEKQEKKIGMFADVVFYENRMEERKWFSGKLKNRNAEYYYKIEGKIYLRPISGNEKIEIQLSELKPTDYDYTTFRIKKEP